MEVQEVSNEMFETLMRHMNSYEISDACTSRNNINIFHYGDLSSCAKDILLRRKTDNCDEPGILLFVKGIMELLWLHNNTKNYEKYDSPIGKLSGFSRSSNNISFDNRSQKSPALMSDLFDIDIFKTALREECNRESFMKAVFNESVLYTNGYFGLMKSSYKDKNHITKLYFRKYFGKHLNVFCLCDNILYSYTKHEEITKMERNNKNSKAYDSLVIEINRYDENQIHFATDQQHEYIEVLRGYAYNRSSKKRLVIMVAGPSGTGKSYSSEQIISSVGSYVEHTDDDNEEVVGEEKEYSSKSNNNNNIGNNFIYIDGGKIRATSNVRSLAICAAIALGHKAIQDIQKHCNSVLEEVKNQLRDAAMAHTAGHMYKILHIVEPLTFANFDFSLIKQYSDLDNTITFFAEICLNSVNDKYAIEFQGRRRAFNIDDCSELINCPNLICERGLLYWKRKIPESKVYDAGKLLSFTLGYNRYCGEKGSQIAKNNFYKPLEKNQNYVKIKILFDRILIKDGEEHVPQHADDYEGCTLENKCLYLEFNKKRSKFKGDFSQYKALYPCCCDFKIKTDLFLQYESRRNIFSQFNVDVKSMISKMNVLLHNVLSDTYHRSVVVYDCDRVLLNSRVAQYEEKERTSDPSPDQPSDNLSKTDMILCSIDLSSFDIFSIRKEIFSNNLNQHFSLTKRNEYLELLEEDRGHVFPILHEIYFYLLSVNTAYEALFSDDVLHALNSMSIQIDRCGVLQIFREVLLSTLMEMSSIVKGIIATASNGATSIDPINIEIYKHRESLILRSHRVFVEKIAKNTGFCISKSLLLSKMPLFEKTTAHIFSPQSMLYTDTKSKSAVVIQDDSVGTCTRGHNYRAVHLLKYEEKMIKPNSYESVYIDFYFNNLVEYDVHTVVEKLKEISMKYYIPSLEVENENIFILNIFTSDLIALDTIIKGVHLYNAEECNEKVEGGGVMLCFLQHFFLPARRLSTSLSVECDLLKDISICYSLCNDKNDEIIENIIKQYKCYLRELYTFSSLSIFSSSGAIRNSQKSLNQFGCFSSSSFGPAVFKIIETERQKWKSNVEPVKLIGAIRLCLRKIFVNSDLYRDSDNTDFIQMLAIVNQRLSIICCTSDSICQQNIVNNKILSFNHLINHNDHDLSFDRLFKSVATVTYYKKLFETVISLRNKLQLLFTKNIEINFTGNIINLIARCQYHPKRMLGHMRDCSLSQELQHECYGIFLHEIFDMIEKKKKELQSNTPPCMYIENLIYNMSVTDISALKVLLQNKLDAFTVLSHDVKLKNALPPALIKGMLLKRRRNRFSVKRYVTVIEGIMRYYEFSDAAPHFSVGTFKGSISLKNATLSDPSFSDSKQFVVLKDNEKDMFLEACSINEKEYWKTSLKKHIEFANNSSQVEYLLDDFNIHEAVGLWCSDVDVATSKYGHIKYWNTSAVTNMSSLFESKYEFNDDISMWDVSNVTNMTRMFYNCICFQQNISLWDVSSVIHFDDIFYNTKLFDKRIIDFWDLTIVREISNADSLLVEQDDVQSNCVDEHIQSEVLIYNDDSPSDKKLRNFAPKKPIKNFSTGSKFHTPSLESSAKVSPLVELSPSKKVFPEDFIFPDKFREVGFLYQELNKISVAYTQLQIDEAIGIWLVKRFSIPNLLPASVSIKNFDQTFIKLYSYIDRIESIDIASLVLNAIDRILIATRLDVRSTTCLIYKEDLFLDTSKNNQSPFTDRAGEVMWTMCDAPSIFQSHLVGKALGESLWLTSNRWPSGTNVWRSMIETPSVYEERLMALFERSFIDILNEKNEKSIIKLCYLRVLTNPLLGLKIFKKFLCNSLLSNTVTPICIALNRAYFLHSNFDEVLSNINDEVVRDFLNVAFLILAYIRQITNISTSEILCQFSNIFLQECIVATLESLLDSPRFRKMDTYDKEANFDILKLSFVPVFANHLHNSYLSVCQFYAFLEQKREELVLKLGVSNKTLDFRCKDIKRVYAKLKLDLSELDVEDQGMGDKFYFSRAIQRGVTSKYTLTEKSLGCKIIDFYSKYNAPIIMENGDINSLLQLTKLEKKSFYMLFVSNKYAFEIIAKVVSELGNDSFVQDIQSLEKNSAVKKMIDNIAL